VVTGAVGNTTLHLGGDRWSPNKILHLSGDMGGNLNIHISGDKGSQQQTLQVRPLDTSWLQVITIATLHHGDHIVVTKTTLYLSGDEGGHLITYI